MFSLAIQRSTGGYIAFGGMPPVEFDKSSFASSPIQIVNLYGSGAPPTKEFSFYAIKPDGLVYKGSRPSHDAAYIVDSGTTLMILPTHEIEAIAQLYEPKAKLSESQGGYFVDCKAKAPSFGVKIGGKTFTVDAQDLIMQNTVAAQSNSCLLGMQDGGSSGPYVLGDTFLQSVVAVFDVGAAEMRFASTG
jgi:hypothetical protein